MPYPAITAGAPEHPPLAADHHGAYSELSGQVRAAGLLDRRPVYYGVRISITLGLFAAAWVGGQCDRAVASRSATAVCAWHSSVSPRTAATQASVQRRRPAAIGCPVSSAQRSPSPAVATHASSRPASASPVARKASSSGRY